MKIGQLARICGISTDTLRYYERNGLVPHAPRKENGYRDYGPNDIALIRFIRGAQGLGFSLAEIRRILPRIAERSLVRQDIEARLREKMADVDRHIGSLQRMRDDLEATLGQLRCEPDTALVLEAVTAPSRNGDPDIHHPVKSARGRRGGGRGAQSA